MVEVKKGLAICEDRREVYLNGRRMSVRTPQQFDLLAVLIDAKGSYLTRGEMARRIGMRSKGGEFHERKIDRLVYWLRRSLGERAIETVYKYGYRIGLEQHAR